MQGANTVTKDFLLFSQPFIHEGALLSSSVSGRRLYVHHLSEVPLSEVFTTRVGNQLQRLGKSKVVMGGIELDIAPKPDGPNVPTAKVLSQIPTAAFTGAVQGRDKMVLQLLQKGKDANGNGEFAVACACFEAAYALSARAGMLVSAANMRLKLGEVETAAAMYKHVLSESALLATEREMATRKLGEAQVLLKERAPSSGSGQPAAADSWGFGQEAQEGAQRADSFASFGDDADDNGWGASFDDTPPVKIPGGLGDARATSTEPPTSYGVDGGFDGGFDADFGDGDLDDESFADFDDAPVPRPRQPDAPVLSKSTHPPTAAHAGFEADFGADFDLEPPVCAATTTSASRGFGAFGSPDTSGGGSSASGEDVSGGFGSFSEPPPRSTAAGGVTLTLGSARPDVAANGGGGGSESEAVARLEARLATLEEAVRGGPSKLAVFEAEQKVAQLSATLERRMTGVKKGMEALHGRLQAVSPSRDAVT